MLRSISDHFLRFRDTILQKLVQVRPEEVSALVWSCAYFFFLFSSYYILRPLRDTMGITGGVKNLQWLMTATLGAMLLANPLFAALVARFPRHRFIPWVYQFFLVNLLAFFVLMSTLPEDAMVTVARVFYVWTSVFNLFAVSVFWGFMADLYNNDQGRRLFGFIGAGGTFGAVVGSALTAGLAEVIGPVRLLLVAAVLLEIAVLCVHRLSRIAGLFDTEVPVSTPGKTQSPRVSGRDDKGLGGGLLEGIAHVIRSPYLLGIAAYLLLFTICSTFLYFEQAKIVAETITSSAERTELFAKIDLAVNVLTLIIQLTLTGRIISRIGVEPALILLPLITLVGFVALGALPVLGMLVAFQVVRRAADYAISRPAREILYTVVGPDDKYKSKSFIDTFVYRGGDALGAWVFSGLEALSLGVSTVAFAGVPVALLWLLTGRKLGHRQQALAHEHEEAPAGPR